MKPSVVIILNRLVIGGQAVDTISLAYYLQQDFDIVILYGEKEDDEVESSFLLQQYPGLKIIKIKSLRRTINPFTDLFAFYAVFQQIKKHKAQVVHTHGSKSGLLGRVAAWLLTTPVIIHTFHGHLFHSYFNSIGNKLIKWVERRLASISTNIIALSVEQEKELTEKFAIVSHEKISIIPLGVDQQVLLSNAENNRQQFRNSFHLADDAVAVGSVGRIVPIKNQLLFLEVAKSILASANGNVYFFVVGDGESKKQMINYLVANQLPFNDVGETDINKRIAFTSWMEDMTTVYHGLDIIMLTSLNEGTPLSIIEAQFCGKPVVASNTGGVKDTFLPNGSGFLIDGYNPADYVSALNKLITNEQLRKEMGHAAISFATNTFAKKHEVAAIKNLYLQQLAKTRN
jgi:glycosyltransferase involved in cell wall biosynthesis